MNIVEQLQKDVGYSDGTDGVESDVDSLIAYKDALEDVVASLPVESLFALYEYNIHDEERDHAEQVQMGENPVGEDGLIETHVYTHLQRIVAWLHAHAPEHVEQDGIAAARATVDGLDDNMVLSFQGESYEHYRDAVDRLPFFGAAILLDGEIFEAILCGADRDADDGATIKFIRVVDEEYDHTRYPADAVESAVVEKVWVS